MAGKGKRERILCGGMGVGVCLVLHLDVGLPLRYGDVKGAWWGAAVSARFKTALGVRGLGQQRNMQDATWHFSALLPTY